jgi:hypothetical protein
MKVASSVTVRPNNSIDQPNAHLMSLPPSPAAPIHPKPVADPITKNLLHRRQPNLSELLNPELMCAPSHVTHQDSVDPKPVAFATPRQVAV